MLKFVLLLLFAAVTYSSVPRRCCVPDQFEGVLLDIKGSVGDGESDISSGSVRVSFDYWSKKVANYINVTINGVPYKQKLILDYNQNVMYSIDEQQRTCRATSPLPRLQKCIPEEAREVRSFYYGAGQNSLRARSFVMQDESKKITTVITSTEDCIPIAEIAYGSKRLAPFLTAIGWTDITNGIRDNGVFTIPYYCQQEKVFTKTDMLPNSFLEHNQFLEQNSFLWQNSFLDSFLYSKNQLSKSYPKRNNL